MITDIKFDCAQCGQKMVVESSAAGTSTECPQCNASIVIPRKIAPRDSVRVARQTAPSGALESAPRNPDPESSTLQQELTDASVQISRLETELADAEKLKTEKRRLRDDLVRLKKDLASSEQALREALLARAEAEKRARASGGEYNRMEGELTIERERAIRLRAEVDAYVTERTEVLPRLEAAERDAEALTQALREREIELQDLRTNLADTQAVRTAELRNFQALETRLEELEAELSGVRAAAVQTEARLLAATEEISTTKRQLADSEETAGSLKISVRDLEKERDELSKSLSRDTAGKDLLVARERLSLTTKERDHLGAQVERLDAEIDSAQVKHREIEAELNATLRALDEARRQAEAASEHRLRQDNEVLRGIVARQNSELEQRHQQIVRLKRAQLGVRLAYAAFGFGLLLIALWAMKTVPELQLWKLF